MELASKTRSRTAASPTLNLSTGQRKRLALAVCLLEDRDVLVFDEWAADQDPHFRQHFYEEVLRDLKARGKTIIAATHDDRYWHCRRSRGAARVWSDCRCTIRALTIRPRLGEVAGPGARHTRRGPLARGMSSRCWSRLGALLFLLIYMAPDIFVTVGSGEVGVLYPAVRRRHPDRQARTARADVVAPWDELYIYSTRVQEAKHEMEVLTSEALHDHHPALDPLSPRARSSSACCTSRSGPTTRRRSSFPKSRRRFAP